jgi:hypothetical protein
LFGLLIRASKMVLVGSTPNTYYCSLITLDENPYNKTSVHYIFRWLSEVARNISSDNFLTPRYKLVGLWFKVYSVDFNQFFDIYVF